jgi:hypothetical protein
MSDQPLIRPDVRSSHIPDPLRWLRGARDRGRGRRFPLMETTRPTTVPDVRRPPYSITSSARTRNDSPDEAHDPKRVDDAWEMWKSPAMKDAYAPARCGSSGVPR